MRRYRTPSLGTLRRLAGKTRREIAQKAGIGGGYVSHLETGRAAARERVVLALAEAVYVEPDDLLREEQ